MMNQDVAKMVTAKNLIQNLGLGISISSQIICEVCVNLKRKTLVSESQLRIVIGSFYANYEVTSLNEAHLLKASDLRESHPFSYWDSLMVASALSTGARTLFSEDMQDGRVIEDRLTIVNPFGS